MPEGLVEVVADAEIESSLSVADDPRPTVRFKGSRPGDPLADRPLCVCIVFGAFHTRLGAALAREKLQFALPPLAVNMFGPPGAEPRSLPPFSYMDDCFATLRNSDSRQLLLDLPRLALIISTEARAFGLRVNVK